MNVIYYERCLLWTDLLMYVFCYVRVCFEREPKYSWSFCGTTKVKKFDLNWTDVSHFRLIKYSTYKNKSL